MTGRSLSPPCRRTLVLLIALLPLAPACGTQDDPELPEACRAQAAQVSTALEAAPGRVTLAGTPLSDCFLRNAAVADVQAVGAMMLATASPLADSARRDPEGDDALRLGYLLGAMRRGARETQGIYDEAVRRVEQELANVDRSTAAFRRGERAGLDDG